MLAVLSYRALSFWLPTLPGVIAYVQLRRTIAGWRGDQGQQNPRTSGATDVDSPRRVGA